MERRWNRGKGEMRGSYPLKADGRRLHDDDDARNDRTGAMRASPDGQNDASGVRSEHDHSGFFWAELPYSAVFFLL